MAEELDLPSFDNARRVLLDACADAMIRLKRGEGAILGEQLELDNLYATNPKVAALHSRLMKSAVQAPEDLR